MLPIDKGVRDTRKQYLQFFQRFDPGALHMGTLHLEMPQLAAGEAFCSTDPPARLGE